MNQAGTVFLGMAAAAGFGGVVLPLVGRRGDKQWLLRAGMWALYLSLAFAAAAAAVLLTALVTRDFSNLYVYEHSSKSLSLVYTLSALWAGNSGSLLLWLLLMALFSVLAALGGRRRDPPSFPYLVAVLSSIGLFFSLLMLFAPSCDPFAASPLVPVPDDGLGLNPQLVNPGMIIHPVTLYVGYVAMAIPFGLVVAGLAGGSALSVNLGSLRRWALVGWLFLTIGNVVGGWWAYVTLGWGGYWAWDPVENASLIPWLTATALLHSAFIAQRTLRQQLATVTLAVATFLLTIFGTFLTRTGVASSVHAFAEPRLIAWFVVFMLIMLALSVVVIVRHREQLRVADDPGRSTGDSFNVFLTVLLLVGMTFFILWGVIYPPIAEALGGGEVVLGTGFFDTVMAPLGILLLLLMIVCSLAGFARGSRRRLVVGWSASGLVAAVVLITLLAVGVRDFYPVVTFALAGGATVAVVLRWVRTRRGLRSYGALLAHLGLLILVVGLIGSWSYKESTEGQLARGESLTLRNVTVVFEGLESESGAAGDKEVDRALLALSIGGQSAGQLTPTVEYYPATQQTWTRVARRTSAAGDVYVSLLQVSEDGASVYIKLEKHPLIVWLWIGGGVLSAGALAALWALGRQKRGAPPAETPPTGGGIGDGAPAKGN